ncbi:MAG: hypothetical protein BIFFINMI_01205 [Phycisphaerae bacterium]|nr:hypothetical protein [Phycisphaerae bacterium]
MAGMLRWMLMSLALGGLVLLAGCATETTERVVPGSTSYIEFNPNRDHANENAGINALAHAKSNATLTNSGLRPDNDADADPWSQWAAQAHLNWVNFVNSMHKKSK